MHITLQLLAVVRDRADGRLRTLVDAIIDVLSVGDRFVLRTTNHAAIVTLDHLLVGAAGIGVAGTSMFIAFDRHVRLVDQAPDHYAMIAPMETIHGIDRPDAVFVEGADQTFSMLSRDDERDPGTALRNVIVRTLDRLRDENAHTEVVLLSPSGREMECEDGEQIVVDGSLSIPIIGFDLPWDDVTGCLIGHGAVPDIAIGQSDGRRLVVRAKAI